MEKGITLNVGGTHVGDEIVAAESGRTDLICKFFRGSAAWRTLLVSSHFAIREQMSQAIRKPLGIVGDKSLRLAIAPDVF